MYKAETGSFSRFYGGRGGGEQSIITITVMDQVSKSSVVRGCYNIWLNITYTAGTYSRLERTSGAPDRDRICPWTVALCNVVFSDTLPPRSAAANTAIKNI